MARVKTGDMAAFRRLFDAYQAPVFRFVLRMLGSVHDAEDVTQEVFIKAFRKIDLLQESRYFSSWLFRIARNESLNYIERKKPKELESLDAQLERTDNRAEIPAMPGTPGPDRQTENTELQRHLQTALLELPELLRSAFVLGVIEGYSYVEVAEMMKCSVGNVKARVFRARALLTKKLQSEFGTN